MNTVPVNFIPRAGAIRYEEYGLYRCANPRNLYYSTMLFLATERWNEQAKQWELIFPEPDTQV